MTPHFLDTLRDWPLERVRALLAEQNTPEAVRRALNTAGRFDPANLAALLGPAAAAFIEPLAQTSARLPRGHFGQAIQFFVPLYVSNICCNGCLYCGFNCRSTQTVRRALTLDEAEAEACYLADQGFGHLLLVASEDLKNTPPAYFEALARRIRHRFASIHIEIYALSEPDYVRLVQAGIDGVTMFQEAYDRDVFKTFHPFGPKADYDNRIDTVQRAAAAGMTFIGLGTLLGLNDWRTECFYLGLHADYMRRIWWRQNVALSFPRMRPAEGGEPPPCPVSDRDFVQLLAALRTQLPEACMTISTRELPGFRENLVRIAATKLSAGAKTTPGGYQEETAAGSQFDVADHRSLGELAEVLRTMGFDPVLKDWDRAYTPANG